MAASCITRLAGISLPWSSAARMCSAARGAATSSRQTNLRSQSAAFAELGFGPLDIVVSVLDWDSEQCRYGLYERVVGPEAHPIRALPTLYRALWSGVRIPVPLAS